MGSRVSQYKHWKQFTEATWLSDYINDLQKGHIIDFALSFSVPKYGPTNYYLYRIRCHLKDRDRTTNEFPFFHDPEEFWERHNTRTWMRMMRWFTKPQSSGITYTCDILCRGREGKGDHHNKVSFGQNMLCCPKKKHLVSNSSSSSSTLHHYSSDGPFR